MIPASWGEDFSWLDPGTEENHPWNTFYLGACNVVDAARLTGCGHIVAISDSQCALDPWDSRAISANLQMSMGLKWRHEGERVYRNATREGIAYTLIRVPRLTDEEEGGEDGSLKGGRRIGKKTFATATVRHAALG